MTSVLEERKARLRTAVRLGRPDRVPVALVCDAFAARVRDVKMVDYVNDVTLTTRVAQETAKLLGDVDAVQYGAMSPGELAFIWLSKVDLPGKQLPDNALWQVHEGSLMSEGDYDLIAENGYGPWFDDFIGEHLSEYLPAVMAGAEEGPKATRAFEERGIVCFSPVATTIAYEFFCGGRSMKGFMLDLFRIPDRFQAAMDSTMPAIREETLRQIAEHKPVGMWVGAWRSASEFLSPRLWERFVFPYVKEIVELVAAQGVIPVLHFDSNWDRDIERLQDLPKAQCVLALDSKTDVFRAKEILGGHVCLLGDVSPALLSLGSIDDVYEHSARLVREVGPEGFILAQGCCIPPDAKLENVQAW